MKKVLLLMLAAALMVGCSCKGKKKETTAKADLNVENVTTTDKEYMLVNDLD